MDRQEPFQRRRVDRIDFERLLINLQRSFECARCQHSLACLIKSSKRLLLHPFLEVCIGELDSNVRILHIEVGDLAQDLKCLLRLVRSRVGVGDQQIMRPCFYNQILLRVECCQGVSDFRIVRPQPIDLLVHRDRLQSKILLVKVFSNAREARDRRFLFADAHLKIAQHVQRGEIVGIVCDNFAVFFYGSRNFSKLKKFLSRA